MNGNYSLIAAAQYLVTLIPNAQPSGVLGYVKDQYVPGPPITWVSESSPGMLSPSQVGDFGGSCTGTGIVLVAAARSVGIPARMSGCSQSIPNDDHHWVEFWDKDVMGPFGDNWHTREGVSYGNYNGPWDSPSDPMRTCLKYLIPKDPLNTIWVSKWSSDKFLPTLWSPNYEFNEQWAFKGGLNRCGAYCQAWGCGPDGKSKWSQQECESN
jgi:hypothetical protein